jgi:hypothetical protein
MTEKNGDAMQRRLHVLLVVVLLALIPIQAMISMRQKSATFEEGVHLAAGAYYLNKWDMEGCPGYPPLVRMWEALPLRIFGVHLPGAPMSCEEMYPFEYATEFLYVLNDADTVLFLGRAMVVMLALLLGIYVYRFALDLFGPNAALLALFLCAFSPNLLAHARLATLDLALTTFLFITVFHFRRAGWRNMLLATLFACLAVSTKYTAWLLFPVLLAWNIRKYRLILVMFIACVLVINMQYGFKGTFQKASKPFQSTLMKGWDTPVPLPEAYVRGLDLTIYFDRDYNHPNWYLGRLYMENEHWWHYYLTALALKVPLPMLALLLMGFLQAVLVAKKEKGKLLLFLPCAVFLLFFSLICQSQLGLRLLLPAFPFAFVATGFLAPFLFKKAVPRRLLLAGLVGWYLAASLFIHPHYLAYFNVLAGGPSHGFDYFADSNLDWGQDLKGLKAYMDEHGWKRVRMLYYGPDGTKEPSYYGIEIAPPEASSVPWAVSATWLYYPRYGFFKQREPDARIGYSILVYDPNR